MWILHETSSTNQRARLSKALLPWKPPDPRLPEGSSIYEDFENQAPRGIQDLQHRRADGMVDWMDMMSTLTFIRWKQFSRFAAFAKLFSECLLRDELLNVPSDDSYCRSYHIVLYLYMYSTGRWGCRVFKCFQDQPVWISVVLSVPSLVLRRNHMEGTSRRIVGGGHRRDHICRWHFATKYILHDIRVERLAEARTWTKRVQKFEGENARTMTTPPWCIWCPKLLIHS